MIHHIAITHKNKAIVRLGDQGINDFEWEFGCRAIQLSYKRELDAHAYVKHLGYEILDKQQWNEYLADLDASDNVPNNIFVNSKPILDKWDTARNVY